MNTYLKVLIVDCATAFYKVSRFRLGDFFGPVDLGLHFAANHNSLNIGAGLLAGSILPGSNRLIFNGFSPCWGGFYVSSMGGAALVFDNLGINMLSLVGQARTPSILYLNRVHGEEIQVEIHPVDARTMDITEGNKLVLETRRGSTEVRARLTERVNPGVLFLPFHFPGTNVLTADALDSESKIPEFKVSACRIRRS